MDGSYWTELTRRVYGGRPWIVAVEAAVAARLLLETLRDLGAGPLLVVAGSPGTGPPIPEELAETVVLGTGGTTFIESFRAFHAALVDLPPDVAGRIDAWDPARAAHVLEYFLPAGTEVAGRRLYGARRREWAAFEDKIAVRELWDAAGVRQAPSVVVPADPAELTVAAAGLDAGQGTVWVADNRDGWHGGAEFARWVRSDADAAEAAEFLAGCSDVARVMPFLDGIPCGIHAMVFPDGIATFRPAEMVVLRRRGSTRFEYSGIATFWDAPEDVTSYMRRMVRRVAEHLRDTAGYRGAFGIDGVLTSDGFFPTELNARYTGGLSLQASAVEGLSAGLLNTLAMEGEDFAFRPEEFEETVLAAASRARDAFLIMKVPGAAPTQTLEQPVVFVDGRARLAADGEEPGAMLRFGPAGVGGLVICALEPGALPAGPPVAAPAISAFRLAGELWGIDVADLEPAPELG